MEKKYKGLVAISDVLDERYQKLCDKYHCLELSHKRKVKCLEWIRKEFTPPICDERGCLSVTFHPEAIEFVLKKIDEALACDGRQRLYWRKKCVKICPTRKKCSKDTSPGARSDENLKNG